MLTWRGVVRGEVGGWVVRWQLPYFGLLLLWLYRWAWLEVGAERPMET